MKSSKIKSVIVVASLLLISGFSLESVLAQGRGGRDGSSSGGGGGSRGSGGGAMVQRSGSGSRGGSGANIQRSSGRSYSRPDTYRAGNSNNSNRSFRSSTGIRNGGGTRDAVIGNSRNSSSRYNGNRYTSSGYRAGINRPGVYRSGVYRSGGYRSGAYRYGYGRPYYGYYNYYRPYLGFRLSVLPFGYYNFFWGDSQYYYSGGLYYRQYENEYKVVVPPVGAEVPNLPSEAEEVTINGQIYYEYKGVYYSPFEKSDGSTAYIISGKDGVLNTPDGDINAGSGVKIGDIVTELPENAREVIVKGETLYLSEEGVYYEVVNDGNKISYRVVGI